MEPGAWAIKKIRRILGLFLIFCLGVSAIGIAAVYYSYQQLPEIPNLNKCYQVSVSNKKHCPFGTEHTKLSELPDHTKWAFVLAEDASFFGHQGVDWFEVKESFKKNIKTKKFARGGSTISQQMTKNLLLSHEKTLIRKIKELFITQRLEEKYSKEKILETYLNIIEFGEDLYGITKAADKYFSKTPSALTLEESLFLATLLPSPVRYEKSLESGEIDSRQMDLILSVAGRLKRFKKVDESLVQNVIDNISYTSLFDPQESFDNELADGSSDFDETRDSDRVLESLDEDSSPEDFSETSESTGSAEDQPTPYGTSDDNSSPQPGNG